MNGSKQEETCVLYKECGSRSLFQRGGPSYMASDRTDNPSAIPLLLRRRYDGRTWLPVRPARGRSALDQMTLNDILSIDRGASRYAAVFTCCHSTPTLLHLSPPLQRHAENELPLKARWTPSGVRGVTSLWMCPLVNSSLLVDLRAGDAVPRLQHGIALRPARPIAVWRHQWLNGSPS